MTGLYPDCDPCECQSYGIPGYCQKRGNENEILQQHLYNLVRDLITIMEDQHKAIDTLLAMLAQRDETFMPSQSSVWSTVQRCHNAIEALKAVLQKPRDK